MTSKKLTVVSFAILLCALANAQETESRRNRARQNKTVQKVDKVDQTVQQTNTDIDNTVQGVESTVEGAKETVEKVGSILFGSKKSKPKSTVSITINSLEYDNQMAENLYQEIVSQNGIKKTTKTYSSGILTIEIKSKKTANILWQQLPEGIRTAFKVRDMEERSIFIRLRKKATNKS
ncbi:hypothetical protein [Flagellimonas allohymeniacidonis]|uniref:Uncharacterized protein n=1 Tax=Flagellimonas allohymeniacidonis TaxID=2517819 RepID=A0A4Q8QG60_9FLAO|nr:hypothetical protein [Allomuricauda hymeniacidonis]TAI47339.1 hypothetical protein EW142_11710 [Allomuricauda hymeniacidonis]